MCIRDSWHPHHDLQNSGRAGSDCRRRRRFIGRRQIDYLPKIAIRDFQYEWEARLFNPEAYVGWLLIRAHPKPWLPHASFSRAESLTDCVVGLLYLAIGCVALLPCPAASAGFNQHSLVSVNSPGFLPAGDVCHMLRLAHPSAFCRLIL